MILFYERSDHNRSLQEDKSHIDRLRQPDEWEYDPEYEDMIDEGEAEWNRIREILNGEKAEHGFSEGGFR